MSTRWICRIRGRLLAGFFWLTVAAGFAEETNTVWLTRSWQSDDGLPENSVEGLAQTADGYLWIGTPSGLARFDGLHFESFPLTNVVVPPNRGVISTLRSRDGSLWLAMDRGGVVHLNGKASCAFTQGLPQDIPNSLTEDAAGGVWVAYRSGAVYRIQNGEITLFTPQQGLPAGAQICALTTDRQGRLWFARAGQVGWFRDGAFQILHHLASQPMRLAAAQHGGVWLCVGYRLYQCNTNGGLEDLGSFQPANRDTVVTVMMEDRQGAVWLGTSFSGLYRRDSSGFASVPTTHQRISSLLEDSEENIWVGTYGGGLDRIRPRAITLAGTESGLPFPAVQSTCEDFDGTLWAATQNGELVHQVNGRWQAVPVSRYWPGGATCVAADGRGAIWIGGRNGLYCRRAGNFVNEGASVGIQEKTFHALLISRTGDVWLGQETPSAILRWRAGQLKTFTVPPDSRIIRAMTEDVLGNIWAGTSKGTLFRVTGERLEEVTPRPAGKLMPIRCLQATPDGSVWIGYAGGGVGCFQSGHYTEFNLEQGMFDNYISQIVADNRGWLWFGANRGIFKVRQQDFQDVAAGSAARVRAVHYGRGEGLPSLQANYGDSPNALCGRDGRLWFLMQTALAVVEPDRLNKRPAPPPTLLSRVTVDDRLVAQYAGILPDHQAAGDGVVNLAAVGAGGWPPQHHRLEIKFAALSYYAPENIQFRYRLKGFEKEWIESGARRSAIYSRLPAGDYEFEMTADNGDGDWNKTGAKLRLVVTPFYWQTWWFRLGALAAFTLSIIVIVRYVSFRRLQRQLVKLEQLAALQKERTRIAKDIHDDLGANLTQIAYLGELAKLDCAEPDKTGERLGKISATARQAIKSLDEIVWAVNPRNDTLSHLVNYTGQFTLDYLRVADIRVRLDFPEQMPARELSSDRRHNIFLTIKEALHNIVKHAGATEVWVRVAVTEPALEISLEDNGRGFAGEPNDALADGLRNMRQRMADIGGECRVASQSGRGTQVVLRLPWPAPAEH